MCVENFYFVLFCAMSYDANKNSFIYFIHVNFRFRLQRGEILFIAEKQKPGERNWK